jgi:hypothetical protein
VAATLFEEAVLLGESVRDPAVCQLRYSDQQQFCKEIVSGTLLSVSSGTVTTSCSAGRECQGPCCLSAQVQ